MPLKLVVLLVCFLSAVFFDSMAPAEELSVHFKTTPRLELLRPFADPIDLSVLVTGADGRPVKQGRVAVRLDAPLPGRFFSTDYPLVEGSLLSELRLPLRQGKADWKFLFPIRGVYSLSVDVDAEDGRKASQVFDIEVRENRIKWLALGAFSAGLFVLGFIAGRIFSGTKTAGIAVIMLTFLWGFPGSLGAQQGDTAALEIESATVGKPSMVRWNWVPEDGAQSLPTTLSLSITHLEKAKVVFAIEKVPVANEWSMKFHFPDGAEYRVAAVANIPGRAPLRSEQIVSVTGVEPPARAMVPALGYFLTLVVLGLAAGRWSKRGSMRQ